jgi:hypothetical protein
MAWDKPTAGEYDANSPMHVILWGKVIDCLEALQSGGAVKNTGLETTVIMEFISGTSAFREIDDGTALGNFGFYPSLKSDDDTDSDNWNFQFSQPAGTQQHTALSSDHTHYVWMSSGSTTLRAKWTTITASRDFPLIFLHRNKSTGFIYEGSFRPEGHLKRHPFREIIFHEGDPSKKEDMEVLCLQLKHSKKLRQHMIKNYHKEQCFCKIITDAIENRTLKLKDTTIDPLLPEKTNKTDDFKALGMQDPGIAPVLHQPDVKLVNFEFNPL